MIPYFTSFLILAAAALLQHDHLFFRYRYVLSVLVLTLLAVFAGLRSSSVGSDYLNYKRFFYSFNGIFEGGLDQVFRVDDYFFEPGFALLIVAVRTLTDSHLVFFFVVAAITSIVMGKALFRLTPYPLLSILIFYSYDFFTNYMVAIRFGIAAALAIFVLKELHNKNYLFSLLLIFLAMSFHTSALVLLAPLFMSLLVFNRVLVFLYLVVSLIFGYLNFGHDIFLLLLPSDLPRADSAFNYVDSEKYGNSLGFLGLINIKYLFIMMLLLAFWNRLKFRYEHFRIVSIFLVCGACLRIAFHDVGFIIGRTSAMLCIVEIIIVPWLVFAIFRSALISYSLLVFYALINLIMVLYVRGYTEYSSVVF